MDKKIKFSDQPKKVKIIYASVIAVLCITATVIGIASSVKKDEDLSDGNPTVNIPQETPEDEDVNNDKTPIVPDKEEEKKPEKLTFTSPIVGKVTKSHSLDTPVFSDTLQEWRVHTGIDISANEGAEVYASAKGVVSKVYSDPFLGKTVEITHEGGITTVYSNLSSDGVNVKVGDTVKSGDVIGKIGDSSISELADEAHLHLPLR